MYVENRTLLIMLDQAAKGYLDVSPPAGISGHLWKTSLALLRRTGIGEKQSGKVSISSSDRIKMSLLAAERMKDIKLVSHWLNWKDFEMFVSEIAKQHNYTARNNVNLTKPRAQIDVIATKGSLSILIDCKHWNKTAGDSSLAEVAKKQIKRARIFIRSKKAREWGTKAALPSIVTLLGGSSKFSEGLPIVPVSEINSFFGSIDGFLDQYLIIKRN